MDFSVAAKFPRTGYTAPTRRRSGLEFVSPTYRKHIRRSPLNQNDPALRRQSGRPRSTDLLDRFTRAPKFADRDWHTMMEIRRPVQLRRADRRLPSSGAPSISAANVTAGQLPRGSWPWPWITSSCTLHSFTEPTATPSFAYTSGPTRYRPGPNPDRTGDAARSARAIARELLGRGVRV